MPGDPRFDEDYWLNLPDYLTKYVTPTAEGFICYKCKEPFAQIGKTVFKSNCEHTDQKLTIINKLL